MGSIRNGGPHSFESGVNDTEDKHAGGTSTKQRRGSTDAIRSNMRPHRSHPLDTCYGDLSCMQ